MKKQKMAKVVPAHNVHKAIFALMGFAVLVGASYAFFKNDLKRIKILEVEPAPTMQQIDGDFSKLDMLEKEL